MTFPADLTPAEARTIEAMARHGDVPAAAAALGLRGSTLRTQLDMARQKAGVATTLQLMVRYLKARPEVLEIVA